MLTTATSASQFSHLHTVSARLTRHSATNLSTVAVTGRAMEQILTPLTVLAARSMSAIRPRGHHPADPVNLPHLHGRPCVVDGAAANLCDSQEHLARTRIPHGRIPRLSVRSHPHIGCVFRDGKVVSGHSEKFGGMVKRHVKSIVPLEFVTVGFRADFQHCIPLDILCDSRSLAVPSEAENPFAVLDIVLYRGISFSLGYFAVSTCLSVISIAHILGLYASNSNLSVQHRITDLISRSIPLIPSRPCVAVARNN